MKSTYLNWLIVVIACSTILPSCFKKFDTESYAPPLNIGGYTSASEIAPSNLVGYWSFDGNYVDSVSGTAGTNVGTTFSGGIKGSALKGALNSYVLFTPGTSITSMSSFTLTYWVNSPAPSTGIIGMVGLAKTDGFWGNIEIFFENGGTNTNGKYRAHVQDGTADIFVSKDGIQNLFDVWTNLALSYDAGTSTFKLYKDGAMIASTVATGFGALTFSNPGKMVFGTVQFMTDPPLNNGTTQPWASYLTGSLDEVRMYNKALSDNEINSLVKLEGRGK